LKEWPLGAVQGPGRGGRTRSKMSQSGCLGGPRGLLGPIPTCVGGASLPRRQFLHLRSSAWPRGARATSSRNIAICWQHDILPTHGHRHIPDFQAFLGERRRSSRAHDRRAGAVGQRSTCEPPQGRNRSVLPAVKNHTENADTFFEIGEPRAMIKTTPLGQNRKQS
jgi:hypothetical protein